MTKLFSALGNKIPFDQMLNTYNPMDVAHLHVMVQMASYLPFDMIDNQGQLTKVASC
jgi:hypothetical protein